MTDAPKIPPLKSALWGGTLEDAEGMVVGSRDSKDGGGMCGKFFLTRKTPASRPEVDTCGTPMLQVDRLARAVEVLLYCTWTPNLYKTTTFSALFTGTLSGVTASALKLLGYFQSTMIGLVWGRLFVGLRGGPSNVFQFYTHNGF